MKNLIRGTARYPDLSKIISYGNNVRVPYSIYEGHQMQNLVL